MKNPKYNSKKSFIIAFLVLTISATLVTLPITSAQAATKQTYAYIGTIPNPVGVNQNVLLHVGITDALIAKDHGFEGLTVTVIDPTGHEEILGPFRTDSTGGTGAVYTPTIIGTYTLVTNFPAQWYNYTEFTLNMGFVEAQIYYEASTSSPLELVVQADSIDYYPSTSLPREYWKRPIDAQLWEWSSMAGNWLIAPINLVAPYNNGPETAHVLWTTELKTGGLVGGKLGPHAYECGDAYEGFFSDSVILGGVLYYNKYKEGWAMFNTDYPVQEVVAVDLHTGEEIWTKTLGNNERLSFGQNFYWDSYNYHGTFSYLWTTVTDFMARSTTWNAYDTDGNWVYSMENMPSGTQVYGPKGEIYIYTVDIMNGWMTLWNSSRVVSDAGSWQGAFEGGGYGTFDATTGIEWNKTIPTGLVGSVQEVLDDRILGASPSSSVASTTGTSSTPLWAISLETGHEGELLYDLSWKPQGNNITIQWATASLEDGVFILSAKETRNHYGFNIDTGELLWSTDSQPYLDMWTSGSYIGNGVNIAYGKLFSAGYAGIVHCYDLEDGSLLWTYTADDTYSEILWSNNWPLQILFFSEDKVYLGHSEHSPIDPKPRGAPFICIDIESGDLVFRVDGAFRQTSWGGQAIIGDSIITTMDTYDQQIYAISKGPSETKVSIQNDVITHGSNVLVKGSVTDTSPGTAETSLTKRFPQGVPAVSDEYMSEWMLYVYKQFPRPTNILGVQVKIEVYDPNGNYKNLGTTTTDEYGNFGLTFEPEIPGLYWILATFEGSDSYYGSQSTTYLQVELAPTSATSIEPEESETIAETEQQAETPLISTELAIIVAVAVAAVIGVAAYWMLKRE